MQLNVLDDLAEAMKALDGKKVPEEKSGLAQVRAVTKSCHAALVFSHGSGAMKSL